MSTVFKKIATLLLEGVTVMNEYWVIGVLHEIGRHTIYYGGNVNTPQAGYFITTMFVLFYVGRLLGELITVAFVNGRKFVLITYLMAIPMLIAMWAFGWNTGGFWVIMVRSAIGFLSSYEPALCILRTEVNKTHLVRKIMETKKKGGDPGTTKKVTVPDVHPYLQAIIHFLFQFGSMLLANYLYSWEEQDLKRPTRWLLVIAIVCLVIFLFAFQCFEPQEYFQKQREQAVQTTWVSDGFFKILFADDDLMWDTVAARLYEAARMLDLVFMILMIQTNPYWKGLFFSRKYVILVVFLAALISMPISIIIAKIVRAANARGTMVAVFCVSIFFYPLAATAVNFFSYRAAGGAYVVYCICEVVKFLMAFAVREALKELINATHSRKAETFKAAGSIFENGFKALVFMLGYFITWFMASNRIQKMNPYNYTVAFLVILPCFFLSMTASGIAKKVDNGK